MWRDPRRPPVPTTEIRPKDQLRGSGSQWKIRPRVLSVVKDFETSTDTIPKRIQSREECRRDAPPTRIVREKRLLLTLRIVPNTELNWTELRYQSHSGSRYERASCTSPRSQEPEWVRKGDGGVYKHLTLSTSHPTVLCTLSPTNPCRSRCKIRVPEIVEPRSWRGPCLISRPTRETSNSITRTDPIEYKDSEPKWNMFYH